MFTGSGFALRLIIDLTPLRSDFILFYFIRDIVCKNRMGAKMVEKN